MMIFAPFYINQDNALYPASLHSYLADRAPTTITARGNLDILPGKGTWPMEGEPGRSRAPTVALFCSVQCSSTIILQAYDLARALRDAGILVISGFHSPMEKECLNVLLGGAQPVIVCPARSIEHLRLPADWRAALSQGRLLLLSPFAEKQRRATTRRAQMRNEFIAALADVSLIAYATPEGKTDCFCRTILTWGKPLLALENNENAHLFALGVSPVRPDPLTPLHIRAGIT